MSKAILHAFKIFLFREQFKLMTSEMRGLTRFCKFVARVYIKACFEAPFAISASRNDIYLLKSLNEYKEIDPEIENVARNKFVQHLWYLSENL